ncbi:PLP-dependent aminotransferase family protein [uncultured Megasphaera sp.]|uniref:aminotransferase-like domain-containing protein n=1 Tax=uncultured Megasphaera sp. TaxID=165188 RepID=UPI0025E53B13|nr:PLP-dependent aminotransferase family protein [uncultured Megasphaera sp.]
MPVNSFETYPMSWRPSRRDLEQQPMPLYKALAAQLIEAIEAGSVLPGTKLPPQRELADFLDVNVSTVSKAFRYCSNRGFLTSVVGRGTFVAYDAGLNVSVAPDRTTLIEMGSMMPEGLTGDTVASLVSEMMADAGRERFFQYAYGADDFYQEGARQLLQQAGVVSAGPVLFASGGQNGLTAILSAFFRPGERLGVDPLVYPGLKSAAKLLGIRLVPIEQQDGEMSEDGLSYALKNHHIKGIYVTPDFQNPTTHTMSEAGRKGLASFAQRHDLLIIEDAIAALLTENPAPPIKALAPEQTVYLFSLSKTILPALRLAYVVPPKRLQDALASALYTLNLSQSAFLMELASRLIVSGKCGALLHLRRQSLRERNKLADVILKGWSLAGGEAGLCRWLTLPQSLSGQAFEGLCRNRGVRLLGAEHFAVGTDLPVHGARLAMGAPGDMAALEKGLYIIKNVLDSHRT